MAAFEMTVSPRRSIHVFLALSLSIAVIGTAAQATEQSNLTEQTASTQAELFQIGVDAYELGDFRTAFDIWLPLGQSGMVGAQRNLGHLWLNGLGVDPDPVKGAVWLEKAARSGSTPARTQLAILNLQGLGVKRDLHRAAKLFALSAREKDKLAQYNLAIMYERGIGVDEDLPAAKAWHRKASEAGHQRAKIRLASLTDVEAGEARMPPGTDTVFGEGEAIAGLTDNGLARPEPAGGGLAKNRSAAGQGGRLGGKQSSNINSGFFVQGIRMPTIKPSSTGQSPDGVEPDPEQKPATTDKEATLATDPWAPEKSKQDTPTTTVQTALVDEGVPDQQVVEIMQEEAVSPELVQTATPLKAVAVEPGAAAQPEIARAIEPEVAIEIAATLPEEATAQEPQPVLEEENVSEGSIAKLAVEDDLNLPRASFEESKATIAIPPAKPPILQVRIKGKMAFGGLAPTAEKIIEGIAPATGVIEVQRLPLAAAVDAKIPLSANAVEKPVTGNAKPGAPNILE